MKRRAEEPAEGDEEGVRRRKIQVRHSGQGVGHDGQRSGGATVGQASVLLWPGGVQVAKRTPQPPVSPFLLRLRTLARNIQKGSVPSSQLIDLALERFVVPPCKGEWEVEGEVVVTVLFMAFTSPSCSWTQARDVVKFFTRRWIEGEVVTLEDLATSIKEEWKCSAMALLILLCANLSPEEWNITRLKEDVVSWPDRWFNTTLPEWLIDTTACLEKISSLTSLLKVSATVLSGGSVGYNNELSFVGCMTTFLRGVTFYKEGSFKECLDVLRRIAFDHCGTHLRGWVYWLKGLCLEKFHDHYTAVLELQKAADSSVECLPAIFNISKIFQAVEKPEAGVEALSLITERLTELNPGALNLQSAILSLHHHPDQDPTLGVLFLYALHCVLDKKYSEASHNFRSLINQLEGVNKPVIEQRSLLKEEDQVPQLPETQTILIMSALVHVWCGNYNKAVERLKGRLEDKDSAVSEVQYESSDEGKLMCLIAAAGCLGRAEALFHLGHTSEALDECLQLEYATLWVSCIERSMWDQGMLKMRSLLHKILSSIHAARQSNNSYLQYKRRAAQCLASLRSDHSPAWNKDLSTTHKLIAGVVLDYFHEKMKVR